MRTAPAGRHAARHAVPKAQGQPGCPSLNLRGAPAHPACSPEVVGPQVALPPLGGSQLDEGAARGVEDAEDGDADTEDDHPVADDHPCGAAVGSKRSGAGGASLAQGHCCLPISLLLGPKSEAQQPPALASGHLIVPC